MHDAAAETPSEWMEQALHDLCQPLTALECRLTLATLQVEHCETAAAAAAVLRVGIAEALTQCARTVACVRAMQQRMTH